MQSLEFCDLRVVDNLLDLLFMSITLDLFERACFLIWGSWHANKHLLSSDETVNNVGHVDIWQVLMIIIFSVISYRVALWLSMTLLSVKQVRELEK